MFEPEIIIQELIAQGYIALFLIAIIEGPLITILGGFLSSLGVFNIYVAYLVILIADTIGDLLAYSIGYLGRNKVAVKILGWLKISEDRLLGLDDFFLRHGGKSIFLAKFITGAGSWTLISAGMARFKLKRFLKYTISAGILKTGAYMALGYFFGHIYRFLIQTMNTASAIIIILILLAIVIIITKNYLKKKYGGFFKNGKKHLAKTTPIIKKKKTNKK